MSLSSSSQARPTAVFRDRVGWASVAIGVVEACGPDAVTFVDGFTTAAISQLPVGGGGEGFFTDARGWVLALATILRTEAGLLVVTDPTVAAPLREHLEHYHIRERLELRDISETIDTVLVAGPGAREAIAAIGVASPPDQAAGHGTCRLDDREARVVRVMGQGPDGYLILVAAGLGRVVADRLEAAGIARGDLAAVEALRIESAYPTPTDIPPKTLPQELDRDARAISFTKGCYLGQETVARLDALGHVNRRLALVAIDSQEPPPVPVPILRDGAEVGRLTSACLSPRVGGPLGLGLVAVKLLAAGGLTVAGAPARPVDQGAQG